MDAHPNFAYSTVAVAPSPAASGTTLTVAAGDGALFAQFPFDATVWPVNTQPTVANAEIVRITGRSGNVLTIQRAVEGTSARTILVGDQIAVVASEKVFTDIEDAIPSIAASNTTYSTGTISITGVGGGVTVSSNTGQRVDISVAAQSVQPETQTFVGAVSASDALYTSGTVRLTGVGGGVTVSSNTGQRVDISVAAPVAQTVQTQNAVDVTLAGNTAGALALVSSGTMTLAGGNNVTLSQAGNAVTISAGAGGAATAISGIGNSQTTYTSGTVNLSVVAGNLTIRSTTGQAFQFSASQTVQAETQTFLGAVAASNTTYTSGTVTITGVGGGVTVSSNTGQRVDISVAAQSVQTQGILSAGVSTGGNTAGNTQVSTGSRFVIVGSGNLTASQATAAGATTVTLSVAAGAAQTAISGLAASNTTYTSGTVSITGVGGGITVSSNTGQRIDLSVAAQSAQTGISGLANSQTTYTSGTVSLSELGAITIRSTTGNQYQLSVNAQTTQTQGILSAGVSTGGNTAGNTQVSTGSRLVYVGSDLISLSQATAAGATTITFDATNQNLSIGASTGGNTLGNTTVNTGSRLVFVGSNNITVSQGTAAGATTLTISGPSVAGAQTGISGIANSQTTYTSGTVSLSELGAVTIRSTTGQIYQVSVNSQTNQTGSVYASSNTFGTSSGSYDARSISIAGSGAVSVAASNSGWVVSAPVQSVQAETQTFVAGIQNSQTTYTSGTVNLSVVAGNLTIRSTTGQAFQFSMSQSVQAETQTAISGLANSQTTYTSGTVSLSELGAITIRSTTGNQFQLSVNAQTTQTQGILSAGVSTGGNTAGNTTVNTGSRLVIVGTNLISASQGTAAGASTITLDATNQNLSLGVSTGGNTIGNTTVNTGSRFVIVGSGNLTASQATAAGATTVTLSVGGGAETQTAISGLANSQTTYTSGTVSLSELGAITIRSTTGNQFQFSVNSQTVQTQNMVAVSATNTLYSSGTVLFTGSNMITVKSSGAGQTVILDATQSVQTQGILNVALSNVGNTSGDTGINSGTRMVLAGGNNITLSASTAANATTITISAPNLGAGAMSAGVSTGGNTAGATGITGTQLVLVGTNMISLSQTTGANGGTVSFNATQSVQTQGVPLMGVSTGGATSGNTTVNSGTRFVLVGTNLTMSQGTAADATTVTVSAPATSSLSASGGIEISTNGSTISIGYGNNLADWQNMPNLQASLLTHVSGISKTPFYWNDHLDGDLTAKSLALKISMVTASQPLSVSVHLGVFTFVNSTSANRLASHSEAFVISSASSVSLSGVRHLILTGIGTHATLSTISAGEYLLGLMFSATATNAMNFSLYGAGVGAGALGGLFPGTNNMSTGTSQGIQAMQGRGSTTVNAFPSAVSAADLVNQGSGASAPLHPWVYIRS